MQILKVYDLSMLFAEIIELVKADSMRHNDALYYFRGERTNFENNGAEIPSVRPPLPGVYRSEGLLDHESDILNEALRTFPAQFKDDKTNLTDKAWHSPTNSSSRFFKVEVEMK